MCLWDLEEFETNGKGYQVVTKISNGYTGAHGITDEVFKVGIPYVAVAQQLRTYSPRNKPRQFYQSGFHISLRKEDAALFLEERQRRVRPYNYKCSVPVMVQVSYQKKGSITGIQFVSKKDGRRLRFVRTRVVVSPRRTILREVV